MNDSTNVHYNRINFGAGPQIYSREGMYDALFDLGSFSSGTEFIILDAMCGSGLVGKKLSDRLTAQDISFEMHYFDLAEDHIARLCSQGHLGRVGDVRNLPYPSDNFNRIYARFGVKNYPQEEQRSILHNFRNVLKDHGIFVLADMEAPPGAYEFLQNERRLKHSFDMPGSNPHIPTRDMWLDMLEDSGLQPLWVQPTISYVTTQDWVNSNQMDEHARKRMDAFLLSAPDHVKEALKIRQEGENVKIDYPVVLISAAKI